MKVKVIVAGSWREGCGRRRWDRRGSQEAQNASSARPGLRFGFHPQAYGWALEGRPHRNDVTQCIPQKGHQAAVQVAGMGEGKHRSRENSQEPLCLSRGEEGVLAEDEK